METNGREPPDGDDLKSLLQRQPEEGWRLVMGHFFPRVLSWLLRALGQNNRELIEDAMQEAVRRAIASLDSFDPAVGGFDAWFATLARNEAFRLLRAERLQAHRALPDTLQATSLNGDPQPTGRLTRDLLECIDALPPLQQKVLHADLRGSTLSAAELAREFGSSAGSIYGARHYGLKSLREELKKRGHE